MSVEGSSDGNPEASPATAVQDQLREEAQSVKRDQVDRAVQRLARDRGVTDAEREVLERLGTRLTEAVLGGPESRLDAGEPERARAIARLFDVE